MKQTLPFPQDIRVEDIRNDPELIAKILLSDEDISVLLEKRGDVVHLAYLRAYDAESVRVLEEAKAEHAQAGRGGYTREDAFGDLMAAQAEVAKHG